MAGEARVREGSDPRTVPVPTPVPGSLARDRHGLTLYPLAPAGPRVVGPGKRERQYLERLAALEQSMLIRTRELQVANLIERGSRRRLERMEGAARQAAEALERTRQEQNRLLVLLGGLQRDNELLAAKNRQLEARLERLNPAKRPGLLARLFHRPSPG